jgi:DNA processing protein
MSKTWPENICDWLGLHLIPGLGNITYKNLLEAFEGDPGQVFHARLSDLMQVPGLRRELAEKIIKKEFLQDPLNAIKQLEDLDIDILTYQDSLYPSLLKEIHDPPMVLYIKGNPLPLNVTFIAVVGSRNPTTYGLKSAEKISQGLARRGIGVASGLANGIDSAAHMGCMNGLGFTIGVLGTGMDIIYPPSNKKLYELISRKGAVISEFPLHTPPEPKNFPIRNRIISGLSRATVVVEATLNSGSLITASLALEHNREVFAVPGSIESFKSKGCHFLIKQGAHLVENSDDILDELGFNYKYAPKTDTFEQGPLPPLPEKEKKIYEIIGDYPIHIDDIARQGALEPAQAAIILLEMELKGIVRQLPGKMFVR